MPLSRLFRRASFPLTCSTLRRFLRLRRSAPRLPPTSARGFLCKLNNRPLYSPPFPSGAVGASAREFDEDAKPVRTTRVTIERDRCSFGRQTYQFTDDSAGLAFQPRDSALRFRVGT